MSGIWVFVIFGVLGTAVFCLCVWLSTRFEVGVLFLFLGMIAAVALVSVGVGLADRPASGEFASVECVECGADLEPPDKFCADCGAVVEVKEK